MAKILIIDDEAPIRGLLRSALESAGHEVMDAADGHAGILLYRQSSADLVVTDLRMPKMNGLEVILALTKEFLNVKVIAISGVPSEASQLSVARLIGARHIMQKPIDFTNYLDKEPMKTPVSAFFTDEIVKLAAEGLKKK